MEAPELVDQTVVYAGKMITVHRDTLRQPDGVTALREVVAHPDSVAVVALDIAGRVLLLRRYRHPVGGFLWELPAGLLDRRGEDPLAAARRELAEETGVAAESWEPLVRLHPSPGIIGELVTVFLARELGPAHRDTPPEGDGGGTRTEWVPLIEAVRRVEAGEITNGLAVAGLLAAARR